MTSPAMRASSYEARSLSLWRLAVMWVVCLVAVASVGCRSPENASEVVSGPRVVSLVPSATETLFAIGAGPQVVGVSSFDQVPAEVATRPRVGALLDPDVERILTLKPDLVVTYGSQTTLHEHLERAGISALTVRHGGIAEVLALCEELGTRTGHADEGRQLAELLRARLTSVRMRVEGRPRPKVLFVFGREAGTLRQIWASGGVGFLHELLDVAGADNVFADVARENVQVSTEALLARAPDVIVELQVERRAQEETSPWATLPAIPAVKTNRVVAIDGAAFVVPGPRIADAAEALARVLHPDAF